MPGGVYFLQKGYVRLYAVSQDGEELTLIIFRPGDFFPIMWAINNTPNDYFVEAMTDCQLSRAPREQFLQFIRGNSDVFYFLTSGMLERLGGLLRRMEDLVFGNADRKVASILLICCQRFGRRSGQKMEIDVPLTHNAIATLVGVTRETASLEMKKLAQKGIITYRGRRLTINNLRLLAREAQLEN